MPVESKIRVHGEPVCEAELWTLPVDVPVQPHDDITSQFGAHRVPGSSYEFALRTRDGHATLVQAFPARDGWPFPEYLGACGRVIVEEYVGLNLAEWLPRASWQEKVKVAAAMLKMAEKFTDGINGFRLYPTDVSIYNLAVSRDGAVKMVDGENIVIVDLQEIEKGNISKKIA